MKTDEIQKIIDKHQDGDGLISILEEIQNKYSYLPPQALQYVAQRTGRSPVDVYGVATFYRSFSLKPAREAPVARLWVSAPRVTCAARRLSRRNSSASSVSRRGRPRPTGSLRSKPSRASARARWGRSSCWTGITPRK